MSQSTHISARISLDTVEYTTGSRQLAHFFSATEVGCPETMKGIDALRFWIDNANYMISHVGRLRYTYIATLLEEYQALCNDDSLEGVEFVVTLFD